MPMVKRNSLVIRPSDSSPHNRSRSLVNRIPARNNSLVNLPIRSNTTVRSSIRKLSLVDQTVARKNSFLEVSRLRMPNGRKENDYTELIGGDDVCTDEQEQDYRMYGLNKRHANSKTEGQQQQEKSVYVRTDDDEDDGDDDQMECVIDLESDLDELFYRVVDCAESFGIQQAELREIFS
ncbi:hypothetical protein BY996DRAFT_8148290 [Phakopsora pachyrhizi]|nr:hypothetical protein BY996DRAFT_8148290 [Phakopsora pachyrhizi]